MASQLKIGSVARIAGFGGMSAASDTPSVLAAAIDPKSGFLELQAKAAGTASVTISSPTSFNFLFRIEVVPV